jgi:hypothetical protein
MSLTDTPPFTRAATSGIDWSEANHAVCVIDAGGEPVERVTLTHSKAGIARIVALLRRHQVQAVGIERPDGPLVDALLAAEFTVYVTAPAQIKAPTMLGRCGPRPRLGRGRPRAPGSLCRIHHEALASRGLYQELTRPVML